MQNNVLAESAKSNFNDFLPTSDTLDITKLPKVLKRLIIDYYANKIPLVSKEALLGFALSKIGHVASISRINVKSKSVLGNNNLVPANFFGIVLLDSGEYKDTAMSMLNNDILPDVKKEFLARSETYVVQHNKYIRAKAEELYSEAIYKDLKLEFIRENKATNLYWEIGRSTQASFLEDRKQFAQAGFGGVFLKISELAFFLEEGNSEQKSFLTSVFDTWDLGNSTVSSLKTERNKKPVENVPTNAIMYTSPSDFLSGTSNNEFMMVLKRALARRSCVFYPEGKRIDQFKKYTHDQFEQIEKGLTLRAEDVQEELRKHFLNMIVNNPFYNMPRNDVNGELPPTLNVFECSDETEELIRAYKNYHVAKDENENNETIQNVEQKGRSWKALKIAGLIAFLEHPQVREIRPEDYLAAIYITELAGRHFNKFIMAKEESDDLKLYQFFRKHVGKEFTKSDLVDQKFVYKDHFARWFDNNFPFAQERAEKEGFKLSIKKAGRNKTVISMTEVKVNNIEDIVISQAKDLDPKNTEFVPKNVTWENFHTITGSNKSWSCSTFKNNKRSDVNSTGKIQVIALDVDNGMSIDEAEDFLKNRGLKALISTTRSHRKNKEGIIADRFRIVLPLKTVFEGDKESYSKMMENIYKDFDLPLDTSTKNISRLWFGTSTAEHRYIEGDSFDWEIYAYKPEEKVEKLHNSTIRKRYLDTTDDKGLVQYWSDNGVVGERYGMLFRAFKYYKDQNDPKIDEKIRMINASFPQPHTEEYIQKFLIAKHKEFG